jgi:hypothetical protein
VHRAIRGNEDLREWKPSVRVHHLTDSVADPSNFLRLGADQGPCRCDKKNLQPEMDMKVAGDPALSHDRIFAHNRSPYPPVRPRQKYFELLGGFT